MGSAVSLLIRQKVNGIDNTAEVILYGSRAIGENKQDSDWDVMILFKEQPIPGMILNSWMRMKGGISETGTDARIILQYANKVDANSYN